MDDLTQSQLLRQRDAKAEWTVSRQAPKTDVGHLAKADIGHIHKAGEICAYQTLSSSGIIIRDYAHMFNAFEHAPDGSPVFSQDFITVVYKQIQDQRKHHPKNQRLVLLVPEPQRNTLVEKDLKARLQTNLLHEHAKELYRKWQRSVALAVVGLIISVILFGMSVYFEENRGTGLVWQLVVSTLGPASSYLLWDALTSGLRLLKQREKKKLFQTLQTIPVIFADLCIQCCHV